MILASPRSLLLPALALFMQDIDTPICSMFGIFYLHLGDFQGMLVDIPYMEHMGLILHWMFRLPDFRHPARTLASFLLQLFASQRYQVARKFKQSPLTICPFSKYHFLILIHIYIYTYLCAPYPQLGACRRLIGFQMGSLVAIWLQDLVGKICRTKQCGLYIELVVFTICIYTN